MNPDTQQMQALYSGADVVVGTDDFTLEGLGAPLVPPADRIIGPSFDSYIRLLNRFAACLDTAETRDELILNRMPFHTNDFPRFGNASTAAAREMWERMWLDRRKEETT